MPEATVGSCPEQTQEAQAFKNDAEACATSFAVAESENILISTFSKMCLPKTEPDATDAGDMEHPQEDSVSWSSLL